MLGSQAEFGRCLKSALLDNQTKLVAHQETVRKNAASGAIYSLPKLYFSRINIIS